MTARSANGNGNGKRFNLGTVSSALVTAAVVIGAIWQYGSINNTAQTNKSDIESLRQNDIRELKASLYTLQQTVDKFRSREIANRLALQEIETQFCADEDTRNIMHHIEQTNFAMLYQKVEGKPYPLGDTYYPRICKNGSETTGANGR